MLLVRLADCIGCLGEKTRSHRDGKKCHRDEQEFHDGCTVLSLSSYKTEFFSFQNNPKNLDPSYKMELAFWDSLGRVKLVL